MPPRRAPQPAPPRRRPPAPRPAESDGAGGWRPSTGIIAGALAGLAVVAVVALVATGVIGGGDDSGAASAPTASSSPSASKSPSKTASSPQARAAATVVVLNGTTVDGLAAGEKTKLESAGYQNVQTTNSQNQAEEKSTVAYASGQRRQGLDVGRTLGVSNVTPMDADMQTLANNSFAKPVQADVVVVVGLDQAP